jgi:hypothetical protein
MKKITWKCSRSLDGQRQTNRPLLVMSWTKQSRCYDHNFLRYSAKKLAFLSETNFMIVSLQNLAPVWVKDANFFSPIFWRKYFKNHSIGPWSSIDFWLHLFYIFTIFVSTFTTIFGLNFREPIFFCTCKADRHNETLIWMPRRKLFTDPTFFAKMHL